MDRLGASNRAVARAGMRLGGRAVLIRAPNRIKSHNRRDGWLAVDWRLLLGASSNATERGRPRPNNEPVHLARPAGCRASSPAHCAVPTRPFPLPQRPAQDHCGASRPASLPAAADGETPLNFSARRVSKPSVEAEADPKGGGPRPSRPAQGGRPGQAAAIARGARARQPVDARVDGVRWVRCFFFVHPSGARRLIVIELRSGKQKTAPPRRAA